MNLLTVLKTSLSSVSANKLRTVLTLLGIVIGVAAVISLMAIGRGAQASVTERIESLGTNLLFVRPTQTFQQAGGETSTPTLTLDDAYALVDPIFAPSVSAVAPELSTNGTMVAGRLNTVVQVIGVTAEYAPVRNAKVATGEFVSPAHVGSSSEVVVLGSTVAQTLFSSRDPVGETVRINGRQFTIIGVLESRGGSAFGSQDSQAFIPITTAYYRLASQRTTQGEVRVQNISVQVAYLGTVAEATKQVDTVLRLRHRITGEPDFTVTSQDETIQTLQDTTNTFVVFLGAIASISLIVGGIGIMNIMLVSVTERTREIGIRKAMGAKCRDILLQFLTEATMLSLGGGALGVLLGAVLSRFLDGRDLIGQTFQTVFRGDIAILALGVSAAIGLFFGIYPALRAARLHPIEALRHE